ncbi:MAG TPA: 30S ribosomal protein S4 [Candidatus Krumholzibacteria bacterium]|nr:30S ribosomal protein S4 [Candidatus Krumholzibacteria bacterium]
MARYLDPKCKLCRREGMQLFLKGERCFSDKCAVEKRPYGPGEHGRRRQSKPSEYKLQLREKQKVRSMYGVLERQFRRNFAEATRRRGETGGNLFNILETRLDNVVYRLGLAPSRNAARQLVNHNHVLVDDKRVNIASAPVSVGQRVSIRQRSRNMPVVVESIKSASRRAPLPFAELDAATFSGQLLREPTKGDLPIPIQENLIIELYSKV